MPVARRGPPSLEREDIPSLEDIQAELQEVETAIQGLMGQGRGLDIDEKRKQLFAEKRRLLALQALAEAMSQGQDPWHRDFA